MISQGTRPQTLPGAATSHKKLPRTRFAAEGYRSASIRAVARDVGVEEALVVRYFGSKPGLFAAATDIDLRIPDLTDAPAGEHGKRLVEHFLSRWDAGGLRRLITDDSEAPQRAALVASQLLGLALAQSVLELPAFDAMPPNVIAAIVGATIQGYLHEPLRPSGAG